MRSLHAALWLALAVGSAACSLLISAEPSPLACSQEGQLGPPACDDGFVCRAGLCQRPTATPASGGESGGEPSATLSSQAGVGGVGGVGGDGPGGTDAGLGEGGVTDAGASGTKRRYR